MTQLFLEHLPWIPVIQPYEDTASRSMWSGRPIRSSSSKSRRFNFKFRRA